LPAIHGFRKFVITNMIRAKLEYNARERLVGHTLKTLDFSYDRREQEELLQEYCKSIDYLTIDPAMRLETKLEEQKRKLEEQKQKEIEFNKILADIGKRLDAMEERN
jgi:hypothetical protein